MHATSRTSSSIEESSHQAKRFGRRYPVLAYWLPLFAWASLLLVGSLVPPQNLPNFEWDLADKAEHAAGYLLLAVLWARVPPTRPRALSARLATAMVLAAMWGAVLEVLQGLTPYRDCSLWDMLANTTGAFIGVGLYAGWDWILGHRAKTPELGETAAEES